ncbi:MAG: Gfo/Idh/MocA family oxidoreductase [Pseudomonadota bacterium]|nr:Gfo/Idh/MocA family oxidoreductase [Pseudomonadota bacterium]
MMVDTVNWGILGTGYAARQFVVGLQSVPGSSLVAVGSRSVEHAGQFAREFGGARAYGSYTELVEAPDVDIVFIGTPNSRHKEDCLLALQAGKAIVCEKPFAVNAQEALEVINLARQKNLFCMEGMWTRFMPVMPAVRQLIAEGTVGEVSMLTAVLGHRIDFDPAHRLYDPALAGGALLDLGVYTISLATFLLGSSATLAASEAEIGTTGVDEQCALILSFPGACTAMLGATIRAWPCSELTVVGSQGSIRIHAPLYRPEHISVARNSGEPVVPFSRLARYMKKFTRRPSAESRAGFTTAYPVVGNGSNYQAAEAAACVRSGRYESDIMPLADTLKIMEIMDSARQQWGHEYPSEK